MHLTNRPLGRTLRHACVAVVAGLFGPEIAHPQDLAVRARRVDSLFAEYTRGETPGVAIAVVRDGRVVLSKGYGLADLEHRVPITSSTVFDVASVSKQFTGFALATLIQNGSVKLTDPVAKYIPESAPLGNRITIDHLLHHTSGLRDWPGALRVAGWRYDDVISFDQILRFAYAQRELNFEPGAEYTYSNTGYNLLAELVARVTGKSFPVWMQENIFAPLGMERTFFRDDHTRIVPNRALGYSRTAGGFANIENGLTALGSSSMFSTVDDMARWVMNFDDARVGGRPVIDLTRTRGVLTSGTTIPYAFGIAHATYRGLAQVNHTGSWAGFATYVLHFPAQHFGVVVLANSPINATRAGNSIADIYLDSLLGPVASSPVATRPAANGAAVVVDPTRLDRYTGTYRLGPGWYVTIRRDGNALYTRASNEAEFPMTAQSDSTFWVNQYNAAMAFSAAPGTQPTRLTYRGQQYPAIAPPRTSSARNLAQYAGEYRSDELGTSYVVAVEDTSLVLRHQRHGNARLVRAWGDDFSGGGLRSIEFLRDAAGLVTGFAVFVDERTRHIPFTKVSPGK